MRVRHKNKLKRPPIQQGRRFQVCCDIYVISLKVNYLIYIKKLSLVLRAGKIFVHKLLQTKLFCGFSMPTLKISQKLQIFYIKQSKYSFCKILARQFVSHRHIKSLIQNKFTLWQRKNTRILQCLEEIVKFY